MTKHQWKLPGHYKVDAEVAAEVIKSCEDENGYVQPKTVVDKSRPSDAELHDCFEWQDNLAAEKWREQQARALIRNIVTVEVSDVEDKCREVVKTFTHVIHDEQTRGYKMTEIALRDTDDRVYVLSVARRELLSFVAKYRKLTELAGLITTIEKTLDELAEIEVSA
jgi:hypothetical protein